MTAPVCRLCDAELTETFVDLGMSPLCESYVSADRAGRARDVLPAARADLLASACWSSCRRTWPARTSSPTTSTSRRTRTRGSRTPKRYADEMTERLGLGAGFARGRGGEQRRLPPAAFRRRRDPGRRRRAGRQHRRGGPGQGHPHRGGVPLRAPAVPTSPRSTAGRTWSPATTSTPTCPTSATSPPDSPQLVKPTGLVTLEFPHLLRLIERSQYDTIYHEHYQYLSLLTASRALATAGLVVVDVDELSTHGGSLRVHARPADAAGEPSAQRSRPCSTPRPPPDCTHWTATPASPRRSSESSATS